MPSHHAKHATGVFCMLTIVTLSLLMIEFHYLRATLLETTPTVEAQAQ